MPVFANSSATSTGIIFPPHGELNAFSLHPLRNGILNQRVGILLCRSFDRRRCCLGFAGCSCGFQPPADNSCRNRHCPKCQSLAKVKWLDKQKSEILPVGYFHLVFTLPHELNGLILTNKKILLSHLFKAVGETLVDFGHTRLGGQIGALLHAKGHAGRIDVCDLEID